jgi:hypothetical protein
MHKHSTILRGGIFHTSNKQESIFPKMAEHAASMDPAKDLGIHA